MSDDLRKGGRVKRNPLHYKYWREIMKPTGDLPETPPPKAEEAGNLDKHLRRRIKSPSERIYITLILCLTVLAAVWLQGRLNRYEVLIYPDSASVVMKYDHITGRAWLISVL
ncbi:MAG: hypothetical protein JXA73_22405 [Acidobacteria bacterium]|nr:hypothetical protein [Acidobacteriota bacterium]